MMLHIVQRVHPVGSQPAGEYGTVYPTTLGPGVEVLGFATSIARDTAFVCRPVPESTQPVPPVVFFITRSSALRWTFEVSTALITTPHTIASAHGELLDLNIRFRLMKQAFDRTARAVDLGPDQTAYCQSVGARFKLPVRRASHR